MGGGVSVAAYPDRLTQEQCKAFVGGEAVFDLPKFNQMCDANGTVSKADIIALRDDDEEDITNIAETVEKNGIFFSFENFDTDGSGGLTYDEFFTATKALGYYVAPENLMQTCHQIDVDNDGIIDEEEFVKFIQTKITRSSQSHAIPEAVDHMVPGAIYDHLSNFGAQHGYVAAHAILKKRPEAARDKFASKERYRGSDWYPLHYILAQDVSGSSGDSRAAAAKARRLVAVPIVQALIKAYPAAAAQRCMEGVRFPKGHLPLELAIAKGWGLEVVEPLYKAYPEAATGLEPCNDKALKRLEDRDLLTTLKGYRWMRQIAEKVGADDAIVSMLPKPTLVDGRVSWISGEEVAEIEEEKARLKAQRIAKKKAKKEAKRAKESEKQKQLENEIKLQRLLNRHSQSSADDVSVGASSVPSVLTFADQ